MIKHSRRKINIPVASMSDIAFLLLIFLMVTSLTSSQKSVKITLPQIVKADKINVKKRIHVYVAKDGRYFINEKHVSVEELSEKLQTQTAFNKNAVIFLYGDAETEYGQIDAVIKTIQENNLRNCVFVTKKQQAD